MSLKIKTKNYVWRKTMKWLTNPDKIVEIYGNKIYLDSKDSLLLSVRKNYEPKHVKLIKRIVKEGDYVVDIGAHIGYYTLILSKLVGKSGKVFAFEPDKENFRILKLNCIKNDCKNVVLENKAVGDKNGMIKIYKSKINTADTRTYNPLNEDSERNNFSSYQIESVRLDDYLGNLLEKINFFKMDIQGYEIKALSGMGGILENETLQFTIEFSPYNLKGIGLNPLYLLDFLNNNGYKMYDLDKDSPLLPEKLKEFSKYYDNINYFTTLYCSKG